MSVPKNILVLSHSSEQFKFALEALATRGATIRYAEEAYRFVAAFDSEQADVALVDLAGLRQRDLELLRVLREIYPEVGIVVLADLEQRELAAGALCNGADIYLMKPVHAPELLEAMERASLRRNLARPSGAKAGDPGDLANVALGLAHRVNNPLTTISGWLQMLSNDRADDKELSGVINSMKEESDRIAEVVRQLLTFAQQNPPSNTPVDITRILADLSRLHSARCQAKGIEFETSIPSALPPVAGEENQIRQACDILLTDAAEALNGGGKIQMLCRPKEGGVEIVFSDNGPTIPDRILGGIFEPFNLGRSGDEKEVGPWLSYGIIRSHGGKIEAESEAPSGARFVVWLPSALRDT